MKKLILSFLVFSSSLAYGDFINCDYRISMLDSDIEIKTKDNPVRFLIKTNKEGENTKGSDELSLTGAKSRKPYTLIIEASKNKTTRVAAGIYMPEGGVLSPLAVVKGNFANKQNEFFLEYNGTQGELILNCKRE